MCPLLLITLFFFCCCCCYSIMALVSSSFAERYAELTSRVPTLTERLLDVQRREVCERREIEEQTQAAFQDVLHIAAIMIADKKALQQGAIALMDAEALTLYKRETAVWFPAVPPRRVPFRANRPLRAFPHAAFNEMCDEERELRQWLYGVERRLRQHIEEACSRSWFYLHVIDDTIAKERHGRRRLLKEEDDAFTCVKRSFFRTVPAEYFRHVVLTRHGPSAPIAADKAEDMSVEAQEAKARVALCAAEVAARQAVFQYLKTAYDVRLFALNHQEVIERYELEEAEADALYPLVAGVCRADFGGTFYHVPALALHLSSSCTALRALCLAELHPVTRTAKVAQLAHTEAAEDNAAPPFNKTIVVEMEDEEEGTHSGHPTPIDTSGSELPPAVEVTQTAMPSPSDSTAAVTVPVAAAVEQHGDVAVDAAVKEEQQKEEAKREVKTDAMPAVLETLFAYEEVLPVLYASDEVRPVLIATEVEAPRAPAAEPAAGDGATVTLSHSNSELTCSPQPLPHSIFSTEEVFVGDPFAMTPKRSKKSKKVKKVKKQKKSSKLNRSNAEEA